MSPWKPRFWRIWMHFVPTQLWQSLKQIWDSLCLAISVQWVLVMVHILQSISSAPRVTVSPKSRDLGSFSMGSSLAVAASTEGATGACKQVSATCLCQCSGVGTLCAGWRQLWLWKSSVPPWPPASGEGAGSSRSCWAEMFFMFLREGRRRQLTFPGTNQWCSELEDLVYDIVTSRIHRAHTTHSLSEILMTKVFAVC